MADRLSDLIAAYAAGALSPADAAELAGLLDASPEARQALGGQLLADRLLRQARRAPVDANRVLAALPRAPLAASDEVMHRVSALALPRRPWRRWAAAASALAATAAVVLVFAWPRRSRQPSPPLDQPAATATTPRTPPPPLLAPPAGALAISAVEGEAMISGDETAVPPAPERPLRQGELLLTTSAQARVALEREPGGRLWLEGPSALHVAADPAAQVSRRPALVLARGRLAIALGAGAPPIAIATPHGQFVLRAGRARLAVAADETRADVFAGTGTLSATRGQRSLELSAGQYALTSLDGPGSTGPTARPPLALLLAAEGPENAGDALVRARLERLGFAVRTGGADLARADVIGETALILISPTFNSLDAPADLKTLAVPLVVCEPMILDELGMVDGGDAAAERWIERGEIEILDGDHPLAGGLAGTVRIAGRGVNVGWARPSPRAYRVAALPGDREASVAFGYDRGTVMPGGVAPARRVGCLLRDRTATHLTTAGWGLFDAAVRWAFETR